MTVGALQKKRGWPLERPSILASPANQESLRGSRPDLLQHLEEQAQRPEMSDNCACACLAARKKLPHFDLGRIRDTNHATCTF